MRNCRPTCRRKCGSHKSRDRRALYNVVLANKRSHNSDEYFVGQGGIGGKSARSGKKKRKNTRGL